METTTIPAKTDTYQTVVTFLDALNKEDFQEARNCCTEEITFVGVLGSRDGREAYFKDMEKMKFKYDIRKIFSDGNDVCVLYEIKMGEHLIFSCGWYQLLNGKINSIRVVFDPRPLL
jgi:predicted ester cyclase